MLEDNAALQIIDMQKGIANPAGVRRNNPGAEQQVEALLLANMAMDYARVVDTRDVLSMVS